MQQAYDRVKELPPSTVHDIVIPQVVLDGMPEIQTGVEESKLAKINEDLTYMAS